MGIDARMFAVVRGEKPAEEQLNRLSLAICEFIGAEHFFVQSGWPHVEYEIKSMKWHKDFNDHPRYLDFMTSNDREIKKTIREQIVAAIGDPPKLHMQALDLTEYTWYGDEGVPTQNREPGKAYLQDGEPILASEDEWFVEVGIFGRYYGLGYERGDILTYCAIAEWLEVNLPNRESIFYGGDSSGVVANKFDKEMRIVLCNRARSSSL